MNFRRVHPSKMTDASAAEYRRSILAEPLTQEEHTLLDLPLDTWLSADRSTYSLFHPSITNAVSPLSLTPVDAKHSLLKKIAIFRGPVTNLSADAIVNAANKTALGGGGVDGAIHHCAGRLLLRECAGFPTGCPTGEAIITKGYNLPARFVIHTTGPIGEHPDLLRSCYRNVLSLAKRHNVRTLGLCGVSTGVFGYPLAAATAIAVEEVAAYLKNNAEEVDMICFACFKPAEVRVTEEAIRNNRW